MPKDLSNFGDLKAVSAAATPGVASQLIEKNYDPSPARETIRGTMAMALVLTLVGVIAVVVLAGLATTIGCHLTTIVCSPETLKLDTIRAVVELVLTPLIGLVGAVTGFYFGEKSASSKPGGRFRAIITIRSRILAGSEMVG